MLKNFRFQETAVLSFLLYSIALPNANAIGTWEATLLPRDINGDGVVDAYFDSALGISWLANVDQNPAAGLVSQDWSQSSSFVAGLDVFGVRGWRLPKVIPSDGVVFDMNLKDDGSSDRGWAKRGIGWGLASELGHMFYVTLGNTSAVGYMCEIQPCTPTSVVEMNPGPFLGLKVVQSFEYNSFWTRTQVENFAGGYFYFNMSLGSQLVQEGVGQLRNAWAVIDGDVPNIPFVPSIPEPSSSALFLAGIAGIAGLRLLHKRVLTLD